MTGSLCDIVQIEEICLVNIRVVTGFVLSVRDILGPAHKMVNRCLWSIGIKHLKPKSEPIQVRLDLGKRPGSGFGDGGPISVIAINRSTKKVVGRRVPEINRHARNHFIDVYKSVWQRPDPG